MDAAILQPYAARQGEDVIDQITRLGPNACLRAICRSHGRGLHATQWRYRSLAIEPGSTRGGLKAQSSGHHVFLPQAGRNWPMHTFTHGPFAVIQGQEYCPSSSSSIELCQYFSEDDTSRQTTPPVYLLL
jgi:hypothetical protein